MHLRICIGSIHPLASGLAHSTCTTLFTHGAETFMNIGRPYRSQFPLYTWAACCKNSTTRLRYRMCVAPYPHSWSLDRTCLFFLDIFICTYAYNHQACCIGCMPHYPHGTCKTLYFNCIGLAVKNEKPQSASEKILHRCKSSRDLQLLLPRLTLLHVQTPKCKFEICRPIATRISLSSLSVSLSLRLCMCVFIKWHHSHDGTSLNTAGPRSLHIRTHVCVCVCVCVFVCVCVQG
jgi:hypothetical protein